MEKQKIIVKEEISLINILAQKLGYSNKKIKQFVKNEMIFVNNKVEVNSSRLLNKDDIVVVCFSKDKNVDLDIIHEDSDIIVINKKEGLLSIANRKEKYNTAYRMVSSYLKSKNKNAKIYVVHRLDEDTSGVLMFAKNERMQKNLQEKWNEIVMKREYFAIIPGETPKKGHIESYLTMNKTQMVHSTKRKENGLLAITDYELEKYKNGYSLLRVNIKTGRRNQIRVHMKENLKPIIGDKKYGSNDNPIKRLGLHATKISFIDPRNKKEVTYEAKLPGIMKGIFY